MKQALIIILIFLSAISYGQRIQNLDANYANIRLGLRVPRLVNDPTIAYNGDVWYRSSTNTFRVRQAGVNVDWIGSGGGGGGLSGGIANRYVKWTGATTVGLGVLSDNGTSVTSTGDFTATGRIGAIGITSQFTLYNRSNSVEAGAWYATNNVLGLYHAVFGDLAAWNSSGYMQTYGRAGYFSTYTLASMGGNDWITKTQVNTAINDSLTGSDVYFNASHIYGDGTSGSPISIKGYDSCFQLTQITSSTNAVNLKSVIVPAAAAGSIELDVNITNTAGERYNKKIYYSFRKSNTDQLTIDAVDVLVAEKTHAAFAGSVLTVISSINNANIQITPGAATGMSWKIVGCVSITNYPN